MPGRHAVWSRRDFLHAGAATVLAPLIGAAPVTAAAGGERSIRHWTLDNGLEVVFMPDERLPLATHSLWYKVGAVDEPLGKSGLAHFFEHAMFKGTTKFPGDTFKRFVNRYGGSQNAITFLDSTVFFQSMPSQYLGQLMEMEADRMTGLQLSPAQATLELNAVMEEKRGQETQDGTLFGQELMRLRFHGHRLAVPGIGTIEDLQRLTYDDLMGFYRSHYVPNNAVLVATSDTGEDEFRRLVDASYGKLARKSGFAPRRRQPVPGSPARPRLVFESVQTDAVEVRRIHTLPGGPQLPQRDAVALYLLEQLVQYLGYKSSVWTGLVQTRQIATSAWAEFARTLSYSEFSIGMRANPGVSVEAAEQAFSEAIAAMRADPPDQPTFETVRTAVLINLISGSEMQFADVKGIGDYLTKGLTVEDYSGYEKLVEAATLDDVVRVSRQYLDDGRSLTGIFKPKV